MVASAILVLGAASSANANGEYAVANRLELAGKPLGCLEIFGESVLARTIKRLQSAGVNAISVVLEDSLSHLVPTVSSHRVDVSVTNRPVDRWCITEIIKKHTHQGAERVLLARVGAYAEFDFPDVLQFHRDRGEPVTRLYDVQGPLDFWIMDAGTSLRSLESGTCPDSGYLLDGYVNRLSDAREFRRLIVDAFLSRCAIRPRGREIKPGIWLDEGARLHRSVRVVAPAYIGRGTKVRSSVLITRCSNLERYCDVQHGTVVEDASILPHTYLGRGLDVSHAIVDGNSFIHLARNVAVTINDTKLIARTMPFEWHFFKGFCKLEESIQVAPAKVELDALPCLSGAASGSLNFLEG